MESVSKPAQKHEIHLLVVMCFEGLKIVWGSVSCASLMGMSVLWICVIFV